MVKGFAVDVFGSRAPSLLRILNRDTYFGLIPDDLIELIFKEANIKISYTMSPITYEMQYCLKWKQSTRQTINSDFDISNPYNLDEGVNIAGASSCEVIKVYDREEQNYHKVYCLRDFNYELIRKLHTFNGANWKEVYNAVLSTGDLGIHRIWIQLLYAIWGNFFHQKLYPDNPLYNPDFPNEPGEQSDQYWEDVVQEYMVELEDEYGLDYLLSKPYIIRNNVATSGRGDLIIVQVRNKGAYIRDKPGHYHFYDTEDEDEHGECKHFWIGRSDNPYDDTKYCVKLFPDKIDFALYPYRIKDMIRDTQRAKATFRKLIRQMDAKRKRKIMTIDRYLATGIDINYEYKPKIRYKINDEIEGFKYRRHSKGQKWIYEAQKRSDTFPNSYRIGEFERLYNIYKKIENEKSPEALWYLMKMSFLVYSSADSDNYEYIVRNIANDYKFGFDSRGDTISQRFTEKQTLITYGYSEEYEFLGSYEAHLERVNPPYKTSRITLSLQMTMYRLSGFYDLNPKDIGDFKPLYDL